MSSKLQQMHQVIRAFSESPVSSLSCARIFQDKRYRACVVCVDRTAKPWGARKKHLDQN